MQRTDSLEFYSSESNNELDTTEYFIYLDGC